MRLKVNYVNKTYGNGETATNYKLTISESASPNELSVKFQFVSPSSGQNWENDASVTGGEVFLPPKQAVALASAILLYCQRSENKRPSPCVELIFDEDTLESRCTPAIQVIHLEVALRVKRERIIEEAKKVGINISSPFQYISLEVAEKIREQIIQETKNMAEEAAKMLGIQYPLAILPLNKPSVLVQWKEDDETYEQVEVLLRDVLNRQGDVTIESLKDEIEWQIKNLPMK